MSEGKDDVERLVELLGEEQTWRGRYFGHLGQASVAQTEIEYITNLLKHNGRKMAEYERKYFERRLQKAKARKTYHENKAEEARMRLRDIKEQIEQITRRRRL